MLLWGLWMLQFNLHRPDILRNRMTLSEVIALWDSMKETSG